MRLCDERCCAPLTPQVVDNGCGITDPTYDPVIQTYRLPKAAHSYDHLWTTEWPRLREVETERYLLDMHGMMYEVAPFTWGGAVWGVRPISQHLRMIPDFASYRGWLVLGGNQVSMWRVMRARVSASAPLPPASCDSMARPRV